MTDARPDPETDDRDPDGPAASVERSVAIEPDGDAAAGRPIIERIGMAAIGLVIAALFGGVAVAAFAGGEPFLAVMAAIGAGMTLWVAGITLFRG
jgi:hypothetical protein